MPKRKQTSGSLAGLLAGLWHEPVDRYVLPNGLTVLLKLDRAAPVCSVQVWVRTGSIHEGAALGSGLSHFLEHMLFKGTARRSGPEISSTVQAHGGYINAYTTYDRTVYYIDIPGEHTGAALDILADAVFSSRLPAEEVEKEKQVILREIDMCLDDPDQRLGQALFETAFRRHPYREPIIGHRDVFAAVTRDDLAAYYQSTYVPNNVVLVVVGDFDPAAVRTTIASTFGAPPRRRLASPVLPEEPAQLAGRSLHRLEDVELTRCGIGWQIPGLAHPDAPALDMLALVLGQGDSSLLWGALRDSARLVHAIDAMTWNPGTQGLFYVSFTCDPAKREAAERAVEEQILRVVRRGVAARDLAKAVRQSVAGEINLRKTMSGQAAKLGVAEVVVGELDYTRRYFEELVALRPADLRRVARTYLVPERRTVVSSSPAKSAAATPAATAGAEGPRDFESVVLDNGARLLLQVDRRLPSLHFRLVFNGGPMFEPADRRGVTSLLATLIAKDTTSATAEEIAARIEGAGGSFSGFSGNNSHGLTAEVLPPDADLALGLLADAVLRPKFAKDRLEIERSAALAALKESMDDVVTVGRRRLRREFFGAHPLAIDAGGDEAGLQAITAADLRAHHARLGVAGNAVLAVAGDFDPARLGPKLRRLLLRLPTGAVQVPAVAVAPAAGEHVEVLPRQQAVVFQAFPGPGLRADDYYVSEVADELFSGMSSRLFERVREQKGLAYFVRSGRVVGLDTGMFYFLAGTMPERAAEVLGEFGAEVARVQEGGVTAEELARCQRRLKAARRMGMQTLGARALQAALNAAYGLPVNDWRNYDGRIDAVDLGRLRDFARRRLVAARRTQLIVRP